MFTLIEENDDFVRNGDQHYTQGLRLSYFYSEQTTPRWAESVAWAVPDLGMKIDVPRFGVALGQNIWKLPKSKIDESFKVIRAYDQVKNASELTNLLKV